MLTWCSTGLFGAFEIFIIRWLLLGMNGDCYRWERKKERELAKRKRGGAKVLLTSRVRGGKKSGGSILGTSWYFWARCESNLPYTALAGRDHGGLLPAAVGMFSWCEEGEWRGHTTSHVDTTKEHGMESGEYYFRLNWDLEDVEGPSYSTETSCVASTSLFFKR